MHLVHCQWSQVKAGKELPNCCKVISYAASQLFSTRIGGNWELAYMI